jgi:hypothetical protein
MTDSTQADTPAVTEPLRAPRFRAGYDTELPEIMKIKREDFVAINVDIPSAVILVLGGISEIRKLRAECEKTLPTFDHTLFDRIETLALAMGYAHSLQNAASQPVLPVQKLSERVLDLRETLIADWTALSRRGFMDAQRLKNLKGTLGYKNQAFDLLTLVTMGREAWPRIQGKTAVTSAELDEAETLSDQLLTAVGEREQLPAVAPETMDIRQAAFTRFMRGYDQLRRAAEHLRWDEGDADSYVPSLYAGRKRRGSDLVQPAQPEVVAPAPAVPAASKEPPKNGASAPVGMPGSDPFTAA